MEAPSTSAEPRILAFQTVSNTSPAAGTPSALISNQDRQFAIIARSEIVILTPALGYQVHLGSILNVSAPTSKGKERARQLLPLFNTTIAIEKKDITDWSLYSDDERSVTGASGSSEAYWRSACWSPTGMTELGGCILIGLTNNCEVIAYEPKKNSHKAAWVETFDLTSVLKRLILPDLDSPPEAEEALDPPVARRRSAVLLFEVHATCVSWSPELPNILGDYSILVIGHRSGHISLWRRWGKGQMEILSRYRIDPSAQWIVSLCWSPWVMTTVGSELRATSYLAVADSSGRIWTTQITQTIYSSRLGILSEPSSDAIKVMADEDASGVSAREPSEVEQSDGRGVTQMIWVERDKGELVLVHTKIGTVSFVTFRPRAIGHSVISNVELEIETEGASNWVGSTNLAPCCGIEYFPASQSIVLALSSASFHSFCLLPTPAATISTPYLPSSTELTLAARKLFVIGTALEKYGRGPKSRSGKVTRREGAGLYGFASTGSGQGDFAFIYERERPDELVRPIFTKAFTHFVMGELHAEVGTEERFAQLSLLLNEAPSSRHMSPSATLRPFLQYIQDNINSKTFIDALLDTIAVDELFLSQLTPMDVDGTSSGTADEAAQLFRTELFESSLLEGLRLRESIARFVVRHANLHRDRQHAVLQIQTLLSRNINKQVTERIGRVLNSATPSLSTLDLKEAELLVSGRVLIASISLKTGGDIYEDGSLMPPDSFFGGFGATEVCPACAEGIPFESIRTARCGRGHEWERCSVTLAVLDCFGVRTCTGCERKALIIFSGGGSEGGVVNALLRAATCCLYCGGRWMKL